MFHWYQSRFVWGKVGSPEPLLHTVVKASERPDHWASRKKVLDSLCVQKLVFIS